MSRRHSQVRSGCRRKALESGIQHSCSVCGFSACIDVCHIRPVASFKDGTNPDKVNALSNLSVLCKNCHYLFDHGMLAVNPPSITEMLDRGLQKVEVYRTKPRSRPKQKPESTPGLARLHRIPDGKPTGKPPKWHSRIHLK